MIRPAHPSDDGWHAVFLPIEVGVRELDSRLLMASALAAMGVTTILGQHDALFEVAKGSREGIYVGKNMFLTRFPNANAERYQILKEKGFIFAHLDEEGGVFGGTEERWQWMLDARLDPAILAGDDRVCAWGRFQADHYVRRCPKIADRVHVTGHPRFDIYRLPYRALYDVAAAELRERYGRFVLANTNFGVANSKYSTATLMEPFPPSARSHLSDEWSSQTNRLVQMVDSLQLLARERPDLSIVVRPHPTENHDLYRFLFRHRQNIVVERATGPVAPWLLAASALIHDGCTTAIEAALAGTPIVTFDPLGARTGEVHTPNDFGDRRTSPEQLVEGVDLALSGRGVSLPPAGTRMRTLLHNLHEPATPLLLKVVTSMLDGLSVEGPPLLARSVPPRAAVARHRWDAEQLVRQVVRPLFPARHRRHRALASAFPGFDIPGTDEKLEQVAALTGSRVRLHPMGRWLAAVRPAS